MKLENLVTSQKLSKRLDKLLKERGVKVETMFCWAFLPYMQIWDIRRFKDGYEQYPAFLSGELLRILPAFIQSGENSDKELELQLLKFRNGYEVSYVSTHPYDDGGGFDDVNGGESKNPANGLGLMLEYLLKNNLIKEGD